MRAITAIVAFLLLVATTQAQLIEGDVIVASSSTLKHIDATGVSSTVAPVATDANPIANASFGNGSLLAIVGTDIVLYAQGNSPFNVYRLDFSASITAPSSTLIGTTGSSNVNMAYDPSADVAYVATSNGNVRTIASPTAPGATVAATSFATGQSGIIGVEVVSGGAVVGATSSVVFPIAMGATALAPSIVTFATPGGSDLAYDASTNRLFVARFGANRVDAYDLGSGALVGSPLVSPQLTIADAVDYDPATNRVYALSRLAATIGGSSWGGAGIANVVVCVDADAGSATALGCSPMTGYGNAGVNSFMTVVKSQSLRIDFDPASTILNFSAGTVTATGTVTAVQNLGAITSPAVDPLVGSTVTFSASFSGMDTTNYSDIALTGVTVDVNQTAMPPAMPDVEVTAASSTNLGALVFFGGPRNATPLALRRFEFTSPMVTVNGGTSASLATFADLGLSGGRISVDFDTVTGGLSSVGMNLNVIPPMYETRVATSGNGDLELGTIGAGPFTVLFHIATTMTATPTGSGPFLGLIGDPLLIQQLSSPFGAEPFFVLADGNGTYNFFIGAGFAPAGLSLDYLGIQYDVPAATVTFSGPRNVVF